jgi:hypothetical protein
LIGNDLDRQVRTKAFTKLARDAVLNPCSHGFELFAEFQDILRTKLDTNAATLAPFNVYDMLL